MAYGTEVDAGINTWEVRFAHSSGVQLMASVLRTGSGVDSQAMEDAKDAVFDALVKKIAELPNVTINSAVKTSSHVSNVTPEP